MRSLAFRRCLLLLCCALSQLPALVFAGPSGVSLDQPLTLRAAVMAALDGGAEARIARLRSKQAEHTLGEARSSWLPQISVSSGAGYSNRQNEKLRAVDKNGIERVYGLASLGSSDGWFNFVIDQLVFDLRRYKELRLVDAEAEIARVKETHRREAIAGRVFEDFLAVVRLARRLRLDDDRVADARDFARLAAALGRAGQVLKDESLESELLVEQETLAREQDNLALEQSRQALALDLGLDPAQAARIRLVAESLPEPAETISLDSMDERLVATAELRALQLRWRVERLRAEAARAGRLPTVGLRGGYSNFGTNRYDLFADEWRVGLDLKVPLFDGLRSRHEIARSDQGVEIARIEYDLARERKRRRVDNLLGRLALAGRVQDLSERTAENARRRIGVVDLRLRSKRASVAEALAARRAAKEASLRELRTRFERLELWAMLQLEVGTLGKSLGIERASERSE